MSKASFYGIHPKARKMWPSRRGDERIADTLPPMPEAETKRERRRPFWLRRVELARSRARR